MSTTKEVLETLREVFFSPYLLLTLTLSSWLVLLLPRAALQFLHLDPLLTTYGIYIGLATVLFSVASLLYLLSHLWESTARSFFKTYWVELIARRRIAPALAVLSPEEIVVLRQLKTSRHRLVLAVGSKELAAAESLVQKDILDRVPEYFVREHESKPGHSVYECTRDFRSFFGYLELPASPTQIAAAKNLMKARVALRRFILFSDV